MAWAWVSSNMSAPHNVVYGNGGKGTAYTRWMQLGGKRSAVLNKVRELASLSVPFYMGEEGDTDCTHYESPWQSLAARCVNGLATKLQQTLFPIEVPFFRFEPDESAIQQAKQQLEVLKEQFAAAGQDASGLPDADAAVDLELTRREIAIQSEMSRMGLSAPLYRTLLGLVITGNKVLNIPRKGKPKTYKMDQFVLNRDGDGNLTELILREFVDYKTLVAEGVSEDVLKKNIDNTKASSNEDTSVCLYTYVTLVVEGNKLYHKERQELQDGYVVGKEGKYPIESTPWIAPRYFEIEGQDYGRGPLELYGGDFRSLEHLQQSIIETAQACAMTKFGISPNGFTRAEDIENAKNLDTFPGEQEDVWVLQVDKARDLQVAANQAEALRQSLSLAFLVATAVQRQGERVTAEEIRYMAEQLENELGGLYSTLSATLQLPVLRAVIARMEDAGQIARYPEKATKPVVVAGFDGLGRSQKARRLEIAVSKVIQLPGIQDRLKPEKVASLIFQDLGIDPTDFLLSDNEYAAKVKAQSEQAMMQEALSKGIGPGINALANQQQQEQQV